MSEGQKQSLILKSEGQYQAQKNAAEGDFFERQVRDTAYHFRHDFRCFVVIVVVGTATVAAVAVIAVVAYGICVIETSRW